MPRQLAEAMGGIQIVPPIIHIHKPSISERLTPAYLDKLRELFGSSIIALWPQNEASGTVSREIVNGYDGAYTGGTLGVPGIGDGNTAYELDGTTDFNNIHSAPLAAAFNPSEGTLLTWAKASGAGMWTDGVARYIARLAADANNDLNIIRTTTNNQLQISYKAGGVQDAVASTTLNGSLLYFCVALTWSVVADSVMTYINGAQVGATQTVLGTWVGALSNTRCAIGAVGPAATNVWSGSIGPVLLLNRAATAAEIAVASVVP